MAAPPATPAAADAPASTRGDRPIQPEAGADTGTDGPSRKRRRGGRNRGRTEARDAAAPGAVRAPAPAATAPRRERQVHPLLEKLATLYPHLFGARFLPLQRGIYEALLERHPEELPKEELKIAMGLHARSGRYLEAIAARHPRHNLEGEVVEPVAPEHVHHAIVELFRRRQSRTQDDLRPQLIARLVDAIDASGLEREAYTEQVRVSQPQALALLDEAFAERGRRAAKREALLRAFEASGQPTVEAFAEMYGMNPGETQRLLAQAKKARTPA
ncbi:MAG: prop effector [Proteobacteria bacterium]|nr:prop effector [Pseudomonadota bacterium]